MHPAKLIMSFIKSSLVTVIISLLGSFALVSPVQASASPHPMGACQLNCQNQARQPRVMADKACATSCPAQPQSRLVANQTWDTTGHDQLAPDPTHPIDQLFYVTCQVPSTPKKLATTQKLITTFRPPDKVRLNHSFRF